MQNIQLSLIYRGSVTCWIAEEAIAKGQGLAKQGIKDRPQLMNKLHITAAIMVKRMFAIHLQA
ncbi:transposase [Shewanella acanthi]|uniref:transposase n=1 Tax=Shewanella acanthi TaxID=2864212 RepID=UPI001C65CDB3|nr:transposase [Shewanella acanthi]QYJ79459.1 transposase [Shewanella acanthi]